MSAFDFLRQLFQLVFLGGAEVRLVVLRVNLHKKHGHGFVAEVINDAGPAAFSSSLKSNANLAEPPSSGITSPISGSFAIVETTPSRSASLELAGFAQKVSTTVCIGNKYANDTFRSSEKGVIGH